MTGMELMLPKIGYPKLFCFLFLQHPDPKELQLNLTGFLENNSASFVLELWKMLLSAQDNPTGIPEQMLQQKKEELMSRSNEGEEVMSKISDRIVSQGQGKIQNSTSVGGKVNEAVAAARRYSGRKRDDFDSEEDSNAEGVVETDEFGRATRRKRREKSGDEYRRSSYSSRKHYESRQERRSRSRSRSPRRRYRSHRRHSRSRSGSRDRHRRRRRSSDDRSEDGKSGSRRTHRRHRHEDREEEKEDSRSSKRRERRNRSEDSSSDEERKSSDESSHRKKSDKKERSTHDEEPTTGDEKPVANGNEDSGESKNSQNGADAQEQAATDSNDDRSSIGEDSGPKE
eukprot:gb/GECG01004847.1/.p1 GENE.gb/GECG01004847.1/~~gb/GECG01004847.1/.p1  ORF type:complete len:342 (+),score=73.16 gb/GECG01004847.1/:1-1026(+)